MPGSCRWPLWAAVIAAFLFPVALRAEGPPSRWLEVAVSACDGEAAAAWVARGWDVKRAGRGDAGVDAGVDAGAGEYRVFLPAGDLTDLDRLGAPITVIHDDLEAFYRSRLSSGQESGRAPAGGLGTGSMGGYFTFSEVVAEMDRLVSSYPDHIAPKLSLGTTAEGRTVWAWKVSARVAVDEDEPRALVSALIHAREPMAMTAALYFVTGLVEGFGVDPEATYLLEHRELWVVPVLNPDGYVFNETSSPGGGGMWRKNRSVQAGGEYGVDLNRNFPYQWGYDDTGSSPNSADGTYRGTAPASEEETRALRGLITARPPAVALGDHGYGDALIRSWGYADLLTADDAVFEELSRDAVRSSAFDIGNIWQTLWYVANGNLDDYVYGETAEKPRGFSVTMEVGNGTDGFWPAADRIEPIARETEPAHRALLWAAGAAPRFVSIALDDAAGGDGDGRAEPGETASAVISIRNHGVGATWGALQGELTSPTCSVKVMDASADFGVVAAQAAASNDAHPFVLRVSRDARPGDVETLTLRLSDDRGPYPDIAVELLPGDPVVVFFDGFESGLGGWSVSSGWGLEAAGAGRTGRALSDSPGSAYMDFADVTAELPGRFDFSAAGRAYLFFLQRFWIDNDFDAGRVEVSSDGGATWTAVSGTGSDVPSGVGRQGVPGPVYDGRLSEWTEERVDLADLTGPGFSDVRIRFRLVADRVYQYDGWYIDDARVVVFAPSADPQPPPDPYPLYAVRSGDGVDLTWTAIAPGPGQGQVDSFTVFRSDRIRADGGFSAVATVLTPAVLDPAAISDPASFAYQVAAVNCAGPSSVPPP